MLLAEVFTIATHIVELSMQPFDEGLCGQVMTLVAERVAENVGNVQKGDIKHWREENDDELHSYSLDSLVELRCESHVAVV